MKAALSFLTTIAFSVVLGALGTPTARTITDVTTIPAPADYKPPKIEHSVDPSKGEKPKTKSAADTQYWVCVALSKSTLQYGWSQGGSESSARSEAEKRCGKKDCTIYECIEEGCVGLDYGTDSAWLSYARGYGGDDGSKAASVAKAACEKHGHGGGRPGYFCAEYIY